MIFNKSFDVDHVHDSNGNSVEILHTRHRDFGMFKTKIPCRGGYCQSIISLPFCYAPKLSFPSFYFLFSSLQHRIHPLNVKKLVCKLCLHCKQPDAGLRGYRAAPPPYSHSLWTRVYLLGTLQLYHN